MYAETNIQPGHPESPRPLKGDCPGRRNPLRIHPAEYTGKDIAPAGADRRRKGAGAAVILP